TCQGDSVCDAIRVRVPNEKKVPTIIESLDQLLCECDVGEAERMETLCEEGGISFVEGNDDILLRDLVEETNQTSKASKAKGAKSKSARGSG
ncbi:hypothetical protein PIB30_103808, partial [Stylosanthes scabra]|nr:hypothetical protein [Stylosanthes scabra]